MPGRITELSESQIIADLLKDRRRQAAATTSVQMPQPAKDTFTVASTPATTYTLNAIPYQGSGGSSLNFSLNGVELIEGVDYTVDYTTAVVTVSATLKGTPTPADVLTADYWTTGDLIALTGPADTGTLGTTSSHWTIDGSAAHSDGTVNMANAIIQTGTPWNDVTINLVGTAAGEVDATAAWTPTTRVAAYLLSGTVKTIYQKVGGATVTGTGATVTPTFPATLRCTYSSSGVINAYWNGTLVDTVTISGANKADADTATYAGMADNSASVGFDSISINGTISDSFNRTSSSGLGVTDTSEIWSYSP